MRKEVSEGLPSFNARLMALSSKKRVGEGRGAHCKELAQKMEDIMREMREKVRGGRRGGRMEMAVAGVDP